MNEEENRNLEQVFYTDYERGLLSVIYRNSDLLVEVSQTLTADYFLYPPHKIIYSALLNLVGNKSVQTIDLDTLTVECDRLSIRSFGVGPDYLVLLTSGGFDRNNFTFYFDKVKNAYLKFTLSKTLEANYANILKNAKDSDTAISGDELLQVAQTDLAAIQSTNSKFSKGIELASIARTFVEERAKNPTKIKGLETGLSTLDEAINGLMPGTLTVIAGQAKSGKSALLLNIASHVAIQSRINALLNKKPDPSVPVLYISTEMKTEEDLSRLISLRSLVAERKISNGTAYNDPKSKTLIDASISEIETSQIIHEYLPAFNAASVANLIQYYKLRYNIGLAIFDYIKMDTVGESLKNKREDQILGDLTVALKNTAGILNIPIISACQINTRTMMVADSDRIVRYCNTLLEFRPKNFEELQEQPFRQYGTHWLTVLASRAGGTGRIPIRFWKHCLKIEEADLFEGVEGEEEEEDLINQDLLTTPSDWEEMNRARFSLSTVTETIDKKDATDLVGDQDDPNF